MKWRASKPITDRCSQALQWCRAFAGEWDPKRLKKLTVTFAASPYRDVVGHGATLSTWGVPHTCRVFLNTRCNGGDMCWEETPVYVPKSTPTASREAAEAAARDKLHPGQMLGEMQIVGNRVRFAVWGRYTATSLGHATVWIFAHELWHWLAGTKQVRAANTEQYARAAACRVADMYAAGVDPEHAAAYLRSHAVDIVHYAHHAKE